MRLRPTLVLAVLAASACRQPVPVDTSGAQYIPAPVAVENLWDLLPKAQVVGCTVPKAIFEQEEIKEWKIDAGGLEFRVERRAPFHLAFPEIISTRVDRILGGFQLRVFTAAQTDARKEHFYFIFREEAPARRAIELIEALRSKR